jgi:Ser/Thr protein kinase RdoA (MazF antagonist)
LKREELSQLCDNQVLDTAARLFNTSPGALSKFDDYEGCANLVYHYEYEGQPRILRLSYRPDRSVELIQAELHFVEHLAAGGVRVSRPLPSIHGNMLEVIPTSQVDFIVVSFVKGRGMRVPDNNYQYRPGAPIQEYFQNWGQVLGQMHRLAKTYQPVSAAIKRPEWHQMDDYVKFPSAERLPLVYQKFQILIAELQALPTDIDAYGLVHNDFNDGNFTVDYDNGDITVFDFDDSCYSWFMYELATAWLAGTGRAMFRPLAERRDIMDRYMEQILAGYTSQNSLSDAWLARLPLFLRLLQMQELMYFAQSLDNPDEENQAGLRYKIHCIENDIPYLGLFDPIYSPQRPFEL